MRLLLLSLMLSFMACNETEEKQVQIDSTTVDFIVKKANISNNGVSKSLKKQNDCAFLDGVYYEADEINVDKNSQIALITGESIDYVESFNIVESGGQKYRITIDFSKATQGTVDCINRYGNSLGIYAKMGELTAGPVRARGNITIIGLDSVAIVAVMISAAKCDPANAISVVLVS